MTTRVLFVAPAIGPALREARFSGPRLNGGDGSGVDGVNGNDSNTGNGEGDDGGLDAAGLRQAEAAQPVVRDTFPAGAVLYASPSRRCRQTAEALGLDAEPLPRLAPCAMGRWQGRTLDEVAAAEPQSVTTWLSDPTSAPHGGESLIALLIRVGLWLDGLVPNAGGSTVRVVAVAEPDIVRAAAVHALGARPQAFWRLDVRPLTVTELSGRDGRWNLISGRPLAGAAL
jgi:broad specificity phosphatase PhoE